jgi:hypothetical protein
VGHTPAAAAGRNHGLIVAVVVIVGVLVSVAVLVTVAMLVGVVVLVSTVGMSVLLALLTGLTPVGSVFAFVSTAFISAMLLLVGGAGLVPASRRTRPGARGDRGDKHQWQAAYEETARAETHESSHAPGKESDGVSCNLSMVRLQ